MKKILQIEVVIDANTDLAFDFAHGALVNMLHSWETFQNTFHTNRHVSVDVKEKEK